MVRITPAIVLLTLMGAPSVAAAQLADEPIDITAPPPPLPVAWPAPLALPMSIEEALRSDKAYQVARTRRRNGILLAAIGGPLGLAMGGFGAYFWDECSSEHAPANCSDTKYKVVAVVGYSVAGLSLLIGVPLAISGQVRMSRVRKQKESLLVPAVSLSPRPGGAELGVTWRF